MEGPYPEGTTRRLTRVAIASSLPQNSRILRSWHSIGAKTVQNSGGLASQNLKGHTKLVLHEIFETDTQTNAGLKVDTLRSSLGRLLTLENLV